MSNLASFLASAPIFREFSADQMEEIVPLFREERHAAGDLILRQGSYSQAVYFLRSGRCAVRVQKGGQRQTVAFLQPPAIFGELSFITGRACSADVEVVVDGEVAVLPKDAIPRMQHHRDAIFQGLMTVVAERLHDTVTQGAKAVDSPVVLLRNHPHWEAPMSFAAELGRSLARHSGKGTIVINMGQASEMREIDENCCMLGVAADVPAEEFRAMIAHHLTESKPRFPNMVMNPVGPSAGATADAISAFADHEGFMLGLGDAVPAEISGQFVVASSTQTPLPVLSGSRQFIRGAVDAEAAHLSGGSIPPRFRRTVDSMARLLTGQQVGIALGGGAAWGWAHIGVISVLEQAGIPIDVVSGCSMGSVIGALYCSGYSVSEIHDIAEYWRTRTRGFIEWRIWRFCIVNERKARKVFAMYLKDRNVNQLDIPFWANAVDIKTGSEYTIQDGPAVDALRASIALPGLLPPFGRNGHLLVDAGIMDPVPVNLVRRMGCRYAIAVNAMARLESETMSTRYPMNMFDVMNRCMRVTGHEIGQARCEESADVVLTPSLQGISMLEFGRSPEIVERGRRVAEENLPAILAGYERLKDQTSAQAVEQNT